jgi:hypothetical protein
MTSSTANSSDTRQGLLLNELAPAWCVKNMPDSTVPRKDLSLFLSGLALGVFLGGAVACELLIRLSLL